jgi:metal-responsive CopG/Arc/MetJ family transcriptional regulator
MSKLLTRSQILGVRATNDFVAEFDKLCNLLGYNRSEVIRYCLKQFYNENTANNENFQRTRTNMF